MPDPLTTITASTIATLAFQKFVESGAGELAKKFTETGIKKMDVLREKVWERLRGRHQQAEAILMEAEAGDKQAIASVAKLLDVEMLDRKFAAEIRAIAHEITLNQIQDNSSMNMNIYDDGKGFQNKIDGGTVYQGDITINHH